ncbi:MAG: conjugal transfer protein TraD [Allosphingosinicella sp.]|uniref:conjugal transfer protein TraD n=1 Tax=Allosphingosinicella sp. TaxID=2823234 RepID=UPI0039612006
MKRRERTRQLIELGGLILKSGLIHLVEDDRAMILGMLVEAASKLRGNNAEQQRVLWRRRGLRKFAMDAEAPIGEPESP